MWIIIRKTNRCFSRCPVASCFSVPPLSSTHIGLMVSLEWKITDKHTQERCVWCFRCQTEALGSFGVATTGGSVLTSNPEVGGLRPSSVFVALLAHIEVSFFIRASGCSASPKFFIPSLLFTAVQTRVLKDQQQDPPSELLPSYSRVWI